MVAAAIAALASTSLSTSLASGDCRRARRTSARSAMNGHEVFHPIRGGTPPAGRGGGSATGGRPASRHRRRPVVAMGSGDDCGSRPGPGRLDPGCRLHEPAGRVADRGSRWAAAAFGHRSPKAMGPAGRGGCRLAGAIAPGCAGSRGFDALAIDGCGTRRGLFARRFWSLHRQRAPEAQPDAESGGRRRRPSSAAGILGRHPRGGRSPAALT
jgi:hypothetical protein